MIRVLLADDHRVVRNGVRQMLDQRDDIVVAGEASSVSEVLRATADEAYDVVLLDLTFADGDGIDVVRQFTARGAMPAVAIFTFHEDQVVRAWQAGATAYLTKDVDVDELCSGIKAAAAGEIFVSSRLRQHLPDLLRTGQDMSRPHERLSDREREILMMILDGKRSKEIAFDLFISQKTVATHRVRLMRKLGVENTRDLLMYGLRHHLVTAT